MKSNLIFDGQILQTNAWYRGMGKYLVQTICEASRQASAEQQLTILFNSSIACDEARYEAIKLLCPEVDIVFCDLPLTTNKSSTMAGYRKTLERYIKRQFPMTDNSYILTSLFVFDYFAEFPKNCRPFLMFYDLTPLLFWRDLGGYFPPEIYMSRFQKLYEAEYIFCISETTRLDLLKIFGLSSERLVNINGGFTKIAETTSKPAHFPVPTSYILFPTGNLPHKNNEVAVRGFEQYCKNFKAKSPLLITSSFQTEAQERLLSLSDNIIFTGNVIDEELEWLYENANSILFASKYEGLGMPILDAVASKKPIITSKIPVFEEMSSKAFYYFDPASPEDLSHALAEAHDLKNFEQKLKHYPSILEKYTWKNTAQTLLARVRLNTSESTLDDSEPVKLRLALVCIHPGISGQLGRLAEALHYSLVKQFNVDYYFDPNGHHYTDMERPTFLDHIEAHTFDIVKLNLESYKEYDGIVYLLDRTSFPSRVAQRASIFPGVALKGSPIGLNDQSKLFMELVLDNQFAQIEVESQDVRDYNYYQELVHNIKSCVIAHQKQSSKQEKILRSRGTHRSIIRRLKKAI